MTIEQTRRGLRSARLTCCIHDFATQPHMSKSAASIFTNLRLRMQKLVRSSATSTKTHLSGQHSADSLRARRRWSQRFPQRRPHKQSKPTGPAENCQREQHEAIHTSAGHGQPHAASHADGLAEYAIIRRGTAMLRRTQAALQRRHAELPEVAQNMRVL